MNSMVMTNSVGGGGRVERRHDLDALRAFAMLLGIGLHGALAYMDFPWVVQDSARVPAMGLFVTAVHGFRMPLFFMLSGYFVAMLWQRRGVVGLLKHRAKRIGLPLVLGCMTLVPLMWAAVSWATANGMTKAADNSDPNSNIWAAAAYGKVDLVRGFVESGASIDAEEPVYGHSPLGWAAICDQREVVSYLLEAGADPNARYRDNNTALHTAAFFGRAEVAAQLLDAGAKVDVQNANGETPFDSLRHDKGTTEYVAGLMNVPVDFDAVSQGRGWIRDMLAGRGAESGLAGAVAEGGAAESGGESAQEVSSAGYGAGSTSWLMTFPFFHHLWFLYLLCWLVVGFMVAVSVLRFFPRVRIPAVFVGTPLCLLWLVPLTMCTQSYMHLGGAMPGFGPDTSAGLVPMPHVLGHYAVFFGFGAIVYCCAGAASRLGRGWWLHLSVASAVGPVAMAFAFQAPWCREFAGGEEMRQVLANLGQSLYAWLMIFGLMGMFERMLSRERRWVRYLSDSSYWLYLVHVPVMICGQAVLRGAAMPGMVKFAVLVVVTVAVLLVSYRYMVRYTWVGRMLNGPRERDEVGGEAAVELAVGA